MTRTGGVESRLACALASGAGVVTALAGSSVYLRFVRVGEITVRMPYSSWWQIDDGNACIGRTGDGWASHSTPAAGPVELVTDRRSPSWFRAPDAAQDHDHVARRDTGCSLRRRSDGVQPVTTTV